nr:probable 37S ribosomal protein S5, mitochondrial [Tanacetum cinerariifolium]
MMVVYGNYHGVIGFAKAKGEAIPSASHKAHEKCFQNLNYVKCHEDHTIAHAIQTSYKKTKVYLWPGPTQGGMKAQVDFVLVISTPHTWSKWKIKCDAKRVRKYSDNRSFVAVKPRIGNESMKWPCNDQTSTGKELITERVNMLNA